jgi:glutathione S-transferase
VPEIEHPPSELTLYTCHIDRDGPPFHPCRRVHAALDEAGVSYRTVVFDQNRPFGLRTGGKRPELKRISGQEKLPVLAMTDGSTLNGSKDILAWAGDQAK